MLNTVAVAVFLGAAALFLHIIGFATAQEALASYFLTVVGILLIQYLMGGDD